MLLTDGNPTMNGDAPGDNSSAFNSLRDVDAGIFSANQLKSEGTRVVAVGVGSAVTSAASAANLRAVSGQTEDDGFSRAADFSAAAARLAELATANCEGSIQVEKKIVPLGGTIADAVAAPDGWEFSASAPSAGMTVTAPTTGMTVTGPTTGLTVTGPTTGLTDSAGLVAFGVGFTPPATSGTVQIRETQKAGYTVFPVGVGAAARNAVCVDAGTGQNIAVTDVGTSDAPGFVTSAARDAMTHCTMYNTPLPTPGVLTVAKGANSASGTKVAPGDVVTYQLTFTNSGDLPIAVDHTDLLAGVVDDATLVSGRTVTGAGLTATLTTTPDAIRIVGSVPGHSSRTVTYSFRINPVTAAPGDGVLTNFLLPRGETPPVECDPAVTPCTTHPVAGSYTVAKTATPVSGTTVSPGDDIDYTVAVAGRGAAITGIVVTDDLTDVLTSATFTAGSAELVVRDAGGAVVTTQPLPDPAGASPVGVLPAFDLPSGGSALITYTLRLHDDAWARTLRNAVSAIAPHTHGSAALPRHMPHGGSVLNRTPHQSDPLRGEGG